MMGMQDDLDGIVRHRRRNLSLLQLVALTMAGFVALSPHQVRAQSSDSELQTAGSSTPPALTHCVEQDERRIGRR